ncbi:MAG: beta-glucosidase [Acidimicrobiia bacterium]|nr:beta-glucosidase [Acidimicrobiia bacterium]
MTPIPPRDTDIAPIAAGSFPEGFLWGAATSSYQIEGGVHLDGRGPSIWDTFCRVPGAIVDGSDGSVAVSHRSRMPHDVALMARLGIGAYRFSIAWPRVQPLGSGQVSASGLDFYSQLVDQLLTAGIVPVATLYHWDLPQALEDRGGWPARDTAKRFGDYAEIVGSVLGDRVARWSTVNEPWCSAMLGYGSGVHAPGRTEPAAAVAAAHHLLLAHGFGVDALRATVSAPEPEIGITLNPYPVVPVGDEEADHDAARRVDGIANRIWYDSVLRGSYPDDVLDDIGAVSDLDHIHDGDLAQIARPIDMMGLNYYRRHHVRHLPGASASPSPWPGSPDVEVVDPGRPVTDLLWAIEPDGLVDAVVALHRDYDPPPLYVHENGAAFADVVAPDGRVHDADRVEFLDGHVRACAEAIAAGVDLRGYFAWSFLDNFEWAEGYRKRFGIVHVDYETQERTPKDSALWYSELIRRQTGG